MSSCFKAESILVARLKTAGNDCGQSLIETALVLPLLLTLVFNAVNIGYFFLVALNLAVSPRAGAEYSIQGGQTPLQLVVPDGTSVSNLVYEDISGSLHNASSTPVRVCSKIIGLTSSGSTQKADCTNYPSGDTSTYTGPDSDPEAPYFVLHRVDIKYTVTPLISGTAFNIMLPSNATFHRQVSMRAMD